MRYGGYTIDFAVSASSFKAFTSLDSANWYRPLSNRTISALLYPFYGLEPYAYHVAVFILFFLTTCIVYIFLRRLTSDTLVALLGTTFFSLHSNNLYVTYDLAFAPELFYTSFLPIVARLLHALGCWQQPFQVVPGLVSELCFGPDVQGSSRDLTG